MNESVITQMRDLICRINHCKKVDRAEIDQKEKDFAVLLKAAKDVVRVAAYKTMAIKALTVAIETVEGKKVDESKG